MITETAIVALPTEGVDRNEVLCGGVRYNPVALPTEGVDRNQHVVHADRDAQGRPPHGGRG